MRTWGQRLVPQKVQRCTMQPFHGTVPIWNCGVTWIPLLVITSRLLVLITCWFHVKLREIEASWLYLDGTDIALSMNAIKQIHDCSWTTKTINRAFLLAKTNTLMKTSWFNLVDSMWNEQTKCCQLVDFISSWLEWHLLYSRQTNLQSKQKMRCCTSPHQTFHILWLTKAKANSYLFQNLEELQAAKRDYE